MCDHSTEYLMFCSINQLEDEIENMKARRNKEFNDYKDALKSETIKEIQKSYERKN